MGGIAPAGGLTVNLSEHFTLEELTESDYATRHGLDNTPPPDILDNLKRVAAVLELVRAAVGKPVIVSSGYRSPEVNVGVGGTVNSAHCQGLAADIKVHGMRPYDVCQAIRKSGIGYDQLILEYGAWAHIGLTGASNCPRNMELTYRKGKPVARGIVE